MYAETQLLAEQWDRKKVEHWLFKWDNNGTLDMCESEMWHQWSSEPFKF